jgi:redox-sensitive bicupin YhaK (pirin superfamily)
MVAGRGVTHSERFEYARAHGGRIHGIQSWVALPTEFEETEPSFVHYGQESLPVFQEGGAHGRVLAGEVFGLKSAVATHSPLFYVHWWLSPGVRAPLPSNVAQRAAYVVSGTVVAAGQRLNAGQMIVFSQAEEAVVTAETAAIIMALGGEPVGERFIDWNFVSSSAERIAQAKADWRAGRMKLPDFDNREFIPLPQEPPPALPTVM